MNKRNIRKKEVIFPTFAENLSTIMETKDKHTLMTTAPIPRLIGSLAIPTIISMLVTSFYVMATLIL